jgi:preprotein translocase subunit SecF
MLNIVGKRKIFYGFSLALIAAGIFSVIFWGLRFGIDFKGGSLLEVEYVGARPEVQAIHDRLAPLDLGGVNIQLTGPAGLFLRLKDINEETHQKVLAELANLGELEEKRFESIGPVIGQELKKKAYGAILMVLLLIVIYITWAFRKVSRPVASWQYGVAAVAALFHDVFIPVGIFSILGHYLGAEIDLLFVTGILTILGFSVHDTIVVFDRIRENLRQSGSKSFEETVNASINQTMGRSINTSLTVLLTLLAIYVFGGETTKYFSLLLMLGIFFGTYSSIFVASSLLVSWHSGKNNS